MFFSKQFLFGLHLVLLFHSKMALSVDSNCRNQEEELAKLKAKLTVCQMSLLVASTRNSETADVGIEFVSTTEEEKHVETTSNTSSDYVEYEAVSTSEASGSVLQLGKAQHNCLLRISSIRHHKCGSVGINKCVA